MPIFFPEREKMGETSLHMRLRTALFLILEHRLHDRAFVASDLFVYWDPTDPKACLAPDALVWLGGKLPLLRTFKAWEHGAPHLAVEVISPTDARDREHEARLERYRRAGIPELVMFDPDRPDEPLRIWDLVEGDLVERDRTASGFHRCDALGAYWTIAHDPELGMMLRVADTGEGSGLWPTPLEAAEAERRTAEARIAELEAELRRRG